jgi:hypothetical protein
MCRPARLGHLLLGWAPGPGCDIRSMSATVVLLELLPVKADNSPLSQASAS